MTIDQERKFIEYVWMDDPNVLLQLGQLRSQFVRYPEILKWLVLNEIRGAKIIEFFNDAEGVETRGVLRGVKYILNRIDNNKFNTNAMTLKDLK